MEAEGGRGHFHTITSILKQEKNEVVYMAENVNFHTITSILKPSSGL